MNHLTLVELGMFTNWGPSSKLIKYQAKHNCLRVLLFSWSWDWTFTRWSWSISWKRRNVCIPNLLFAQFSCFIIPVSHIYCCVFKIDNNFKKYLCTCTFLMFYYTSCILYYLIFEIYHNFKKCSWTYIYMDFIQTEDLSWTNKT